VILPNPILNLIGIVIVIEIILMGIGGGVVEIPGCPHLCMKPGRCCALEVRK